MVTLSNSTLRQNVYETVYDLINGISFNASVSVTVTAAFIEEDRALPQVVVHPVDISTGDFVLNRSTSMKTVQVLIEVFSKKRKDLDIITDDILSTMETASTPGMMLNGVEESTAMNAPAGLKIHSKAISLTYVRMS